MSTCFHFEDVGLCIYSQTLLHRLDLLANSCHDLVSKDSYNKKKTVQLTLKCGTRDMFKIHVCGRNYLPPSFNITEAGWSTY